MLKMRFKICPDVDAETFKGPGYSTDGAGCFDIFAIEDAGPVLPDASKVLRTGLIPEVPEGWVLLLLSRSGHGFKSDVRLSNCVGVIDADYRGEILVKLRADSCHKLPIFKGTAIVQGLLVKAEQWEFEVILDQSVQLSETNRGEGGFGSTDKTPDRKYFGQPRAGSFA